MMGMKSFTRHLNIRKVWEDFGNKQGLWLVFSASKVSDIIPPFFYSSSFQPLPKGTIYFIAPVHWHAHTFPPNSCLLHCLPWFTHNLPSPSFRFFSFFSHSPYTNSIQTLISWIITSHSELLECTVKFKIMLISLCGGIRCVWVLLQTDTFIYTWVIFHHSSLINN